MKKLYLSQNDSKISGVCGGIAELQNILQLIQPLYDWCGFYLQ